MGGNITYAGGLDDVKYNDRLNWEIHHCNYNFQLLAIIKNKITNLKDYYAACLHFCSGAVSRTHKNLVQSRVRSGFHCCDSCMTAR